MLGFRLRPLHVITGTVHVEGGAAYDYEQRPGTRVRGGHRYQFTRTAVYSNSRRRANVIVTWAVRALRSVSLARTPFGILVAPDQIPALKDLLKRTAKRIALFNTDPTNDCVLRSYLVVEKLQGPRLTQLEAWLATNGRPEMVKLRDVLRAPEGLA